MQGLRLGVRGSKLRVNEIEPLVLESESMCIRFVKKF